MGTLQKAVLLDRDGVLIEDVHLLSIADDVRILPGVRQGLLKLKQAGYRFAVVTNQTVISRGLATPAEVDAVNDYINSSLDGLIEKFYVCPHHPHADIDKYRTDCSCRKPKPGMLLRAADEMGFSLAESWLVGDRISDIVAGAAAGCRTILMQSGKHDDAPIVSAAMPAELPEPDFVCIAFNDVCRIILSEGGEA